LAFHRCWLVKSRLVLRCSNTCCKAYVQTVVYSLTVQKDRKRSDECKVWQW
jgi:hypothetical protein